MIHKKLLTGALLSLIVSSSAHAIDSVLTIVNDSEYNVSINDSAINNGKNIGGVTDGNLHSFY